ncbi:MAG: 3'(2'),5'-bisphosphate nucleotidase CysQ [Flavobacteriaceae bacterium]|nr:3'(2'),5'-bisphosphate nucleotidase CysQ [Flavobacteriaceae bacterium]
MIGTLKINKNLQTALKASLKAGEVIMQVYGRGDFNIEIKGDNSPLTEADKKANDIINLFLIPTEIPIISEENRQTDYTIRKNWKTCWIVDPVDGTKEFIKRNGEFTVNIALVTNGKPVLGVIYVPVSKTLYFSDVLEKKGYKAILDSHSESIEEIIEKAMLLKPKGKNSNPIQVVGSRSHMSQETLDYVEDLKGNGNNVEIVSKGSSLKFCLVAEGNADVYPRFAPTMEWDTAAGQAICEAVNIKVISLQTNKKLLYNKEDLLNPWFICNNIN